MVQRHDGRRIVVLVGPQGSGKGTQAEMLTEHLGVPVIATGELCRQEIAKKTLIGEQIASYVHQGKLVPDDIIQALLEQRLRQPDAARGCIFDGYPRTLEQARTLDTFAPPDIVIAIELSDRVAVERISGRVVCAACGAVYHHQNRPAQNHAVCDRCGGELIQRRDDQEEQALRKRLAIYREQVEPLAQYYSEQKVWQVIDGSPSIHLVHEAILGAITATAE